MSALPATAPRARRLSLDTPWLPVAVIVGVQALIILLISPQRDYPVLDDWAYAQVVQSILAGQPHLSEFLAPTLIFHAAWGALWSAVFGFSFTVLNLANLTMAVLGSLAFYGLLRELRFAPALALAGTLTWELNPLTLLLGYSFQSNLTLMAMLLVALWAFVAALRRPHALTWLLIGGLFSAAAVLTRQVGVAAPVAAALVWTWHVGPRRAAPGVAAALLPPAVACPRPAPPRLTRSALSSPMIARSARAARSTCWGGPLARRGWPADDSSTPGGAQFGRDLGGDG